MPTIKELYSLVDFRGTDPSGYSGTDTSALIPYIDPTYFDFGFGDTDAGERLIDAQYWSSNEYVSTTMGGSATVFGFNFADGRIKGYPRDNGPGGGANTMYLRLVRGNANYGINLFVDNEDFTVSDYATGLMWSQADSGTGMSWEQALTWVQIKNAENYLGFDDWRLPDAKELQTIFDYTRSPATHGTAAIDPAFSCTPITAEDGSSDFPFYWTSTTHANWTGSGRWAVYHCFGTAFGYLGSGWIDVHGAGAQRSDPKYDDGTDYSSGHGPQGDAIRVDNFVRLVRTFLPSDGDDVSNPVSDSVPVAMSVRAPVGSGANIVIPGMVFKGPNKTKIVVRGVGPMLADFGINGALENPEIVIYSGATAMAANDDWEDAPEDLTAYFQQVGLSILDSGAKDAAAYLELDPGVYTMHFKGVNDGEGIGLAEVYVVDPEISGSGLVALSARAEVGAGDRVVIPGFAITGTQNRRVLIRGVGPGLSDNISNYLLDPQIEVFQMVDADSTSIGFNEDWGDDDLVNLYLASDEIGAAPLLYDSKDAAILLTLAPGIYTAHIRSSDGTLGVGLLELFFLD